MAQYLDRAGLRVVLQHIKSNYAKSADLKKASDKLGALGISDISGLSDALTAAKLSAKVVDSLPTTGERGVLYLVAAASPDASSNNNYVEYVWIEDTSKFEKLGDTAVNLSGYVKSGDLKALTITLNGNAGVTYDTKSTKSLNITAASVGATTTSAVATQISEAIKNKVDKVDGKGLSTNDYTTAEKTKLSGIAEKATADSAITVGTSTDSTTDANYASGSVYALCNLYL